MSKEELRHFAVELSGNRKKPEARGYRTNRTISVVAPDIVTAILTAHKEMKKDYEEVFVVSASHRGVVQLIAPHTEWKLK